MIWYGARDLRMEVSDMLISIVRLGFEDADGEERGRKEGDSGTSSAHHRSASEPELALAACRIFLQPCFVYPIRLSHFFSSVFNQPCHLKIEQCSVSYNNVQNSNHKKI
jgi:hypothetical protein